MVFTCSPGTRRNRCPHQAAQSWQQSSVCQVGEGGEEIATWLAGGGFSQSYGWNLRPWKCSQVSERKHGLCKGFTTVVWVRGGSSFTTRPCTTLTSFFLFFPETNTQSKHQEGVAGTDGTSQQRWQVTGRSTCFIPAASLSTLRPDTLTAFFLRMGAQHMRRCIHPGFFSFTFFILGFSSIYQMALQ